MRRFETFSDVLRRLWQLFSSLHSVVQRWVCRDGISVIVVAVEFVVVFGVAAMGVQGWYGISEEGFL